MTNWALFAATAIEPLAIQILQPPPGDSEAPALAAAKLARPLARLEAELAGRDWLMDRFSAADICVAECLRYARAMRRWLRASRSPSAGWRAARPDRPSRRCGPARMAEPA